MLDLCEVCVDDIWLDVPRAEAVATSFGFEFVYYKLINTTEEEINAEMMADSIQAVRNGMGEGHMREGIVLRPPVELIFPGTNGRIICKHKRPEFAERKNTPRFTDPDKLKVLEDAKEAADEWVNMMRLKHVLDKMPDLTMTMKDTDKVIKAMVEDIEVEGKDEIVMSKEVKKAIGKETVKYFKKYLEERIF